MPFLLFTLALSTVALAQVQASPSPAPSVTAAPRNPGSTQDVPVLPATTRSRAAAVYPVLDIIPIATFEGIGGYQPGRGGGDVGIRQPLDIAGTVKIPLGDTFSVSLDRLVGGTLNTGPERVTDAAGAFVYPKYSRDIVLVYRADAQFQRFLTEGGFAFRHRACCPASGDPTNPSSTEAHYGFLGATYVTTPIRELGSASFAFNITGQLANHRKSALAKPSPLDIGDTHERTTSLYVSVTYPFDRRRTFLAQVRETWGALNWYENAPFPYQWAGQTTYTVTKKYNSVFGLVFAYVDKHQRRQGAPYVFPNAQHQEAWTVAADFHIDTAPDRH